MEKGKLSINSKAHKYTARENFIFFTKIDLSLFILGYIVYREANNYIIFAITCSKAVQAVIEFILHFNFAFFPFLQAQWKY